jgi:hypothetical protein
MIGMGGAGHASLDRGVIRMMRRLGAERWGQSATRRLDWLRYAGWFESRGLGPSPRWCDGETVRRSSTFSSGRVCRALEPVLVACWSLVVVAIGAGLRRRLWAGSSTGLLCSSLSAPVVVVAPYLYSDDDSPRAPDRAPPPGRRCVRLSAQLMRKMSGCKNPVSDTCRPNRDTAAPDRYHYMP